MDGKANGHAHSWNIVKIKDFSYHVDVTFDMGRTIHKGFIRYDYFNFRDEDFNQREVANAHLMPKCSAIEYNYVIKAGGFVSSKERMQLYMIRCFQKRKSCMYIKDNTEGMTFILTSCNARYGYIPTNKAYDYGCYESFTGDFARGTGDQLAQAYVDMLNELAG